MSVHFYCIFCNSFVVSHDQIHDLEFVAADLPIPLCVVLHHKIIANKGFNLFWKLANNELTCMFLHQNICDDRESVVCNRVFEVVSHVWIIDKLKKYFVGFSLAVELED